MSGNKHNLYILSKITEGDSFTNEDFSKISATISRFDFSSITDNEIKRIQFLLDKPVIDANPLLLERLSSKILTKANNENPNLIFSLINVKNNNSETLLTKLVSAISIFNEKNILKQSIENKKTPSLSY